MKNSPNRFSTYFVSILISLGVGLLAYYCNREAFADYESLALPALSPPPWIFSVIWWVLYLLMGISSARIKLSDSKEKGDALFVYGTTLVLNFMWTLFFFTFGARLIAFFWLVFLFLMTLLMIKKFSDIDKTAGKMQIPQVIWMAFVGYLNLAIYFME